MPVTPSAVWDKERRTSKLTGYQPSSRFSDRPNLKGIRLGMMDQDTQERSLASVQLRLQTRTYAHAHMHILHTTHMPKPKLPPFPEVNNKRDSEEGFTAAAVPLACEKTGN